MTDMVSEFIIVFLVSFLIIFILESFINKLVLNKGFVSKNEKKKRVAGENVIAISGAVIPIAFTLALIFSFFITGKSPSDLFGSFKTFLGFLIGGFVIFLVGILHDIKPILKRVRFVFYVLAALCAVTSGIAIFKMGLPLYKGGAVILFSFIGYVVSVLWIILSMFAMKLMNEMEQYQSGIIAASFFVTFTMGLMINNAAVQIMSITMAGVYVGFLPYNLGKHMNIMGETGAVFTGYTLAVLSIIGSIKGAVALGIIIPFILIGYPIFEIITYFIRSKFHRKKTEPPVLGPLYFRMKQKNNDERQVFLVIILILIISFFSSLILLDKGRRICLLFLAVSTLAVYFAYNNKKRLDDKDKPKKNK